MDDWGNHHHHHHYHDQSGSSDPFRRHRDTAPSMDQEGDWMEEDSGLEKNQELEEQVARLNDDFSQKLEVLEQERHSLQSQLTQRQAEYENTIRDLQDDVSNLQEQLRHHDNQSERKHVQDLRKLQQQNEQLSEQLRQSLAQQQALSAEAGQLREQLTSRRSTLHQRVDHVDKLEEEVVYLRQRHQELEGQIRQVREERDALATELDSLQERLLLLEKQRRLQDEQLHHQDNELRELRETNSILQSQLEHVTTSHGSHVPGDSPTLFSELSHLNDLNISPPTSFLQFHNGERMSCLSAEILEEDDFEYDDDIFCDVNKCSSPALPDHGYHGTSLQEEMLCGQEQTIMDRASLEEEKEGVAIGGGDTSMRSSPARCPPISLSVPLQELLKDISSDEDETDGATARDNITARAEIEPDVVMEMTCDSNVKVEEEEEEEDIRSRQSQHLLNEMLQSRIERLERRVQELESRVHELQQERDKLQDIACGDVNVEHVLQKTRSERDNAMGRISVMEGELSRMTREVVTLNCQLMDTVRRKVIVSQELDQWQIDLSEVLAVQKQRRQREKQKVENTVGLLPRGAQADPTSARKRNR